MPLSPDVVGPARTTATAARCCLACGAVPAGPATDTAGVRRRTVTVLFVDIVGFTSLVDRLEPEQVRDLQMDYFTVVSDVVRRHGGVVEKYVGDAVLAVFGALDAAPDAALRAVRAALQVQRAVPARPMGGIAVQVRAGVATGPAVVDLAAVRDRGQALVSGAVVPTAARLQASAPAGTVIVCAGTYRSTAGRLTYQELPPVSLAGKALPVPVWLAVVAPAQRPAGDRATAHTRAGGRGRPPARPSARPGVRPAAAARPRHPVAVAGRSPAGRPARTRAGHPVPAAMRPHARIGAVQTPIARPGAGSRLARAVTELLAPAVLVAVLLVLVGWQSARSAATSPWWGVLAALFAAVVPFGYVARGVRRGRMTDHHVSLREQRGVPLLFAIGSVLLGLAVLALAGAPRDLVALLAASAVGLAVCALITIRWKISIHTAVTAGAVAVLVALHGPVLSAATGAVALVGWARVRLGAHTVAQVLVGAAVGALVAGVVFPALR